MRCPFCGNADTQVKDSRPAEDHVAIRRRRFCPECGGRFTTYERVQLRDLVVIKSNGRREDFDRDKLERSIRIALQKRPIEPERMDKMISGIVRRLESMGEQDIPSRTIGEIVIHGNQTAALPDSYVRYLENAFREALDLGGTPVKIELRTGDNPFAGKRNTLTPRQQRRRPEAEPQRAHRHRHAVRGQLCLYGAGGAPEHRGGQHGGDAGQSRDRHVAGAP